MTGHPNDTRLVGTTRPGNGASDGFRQRGEVGLAREAPCQVIDGALEMMQSPCHFFWNLQMTFNGCFFPGQ